MHGYCTLDRRLEVVSHTANLAKILRSKTPARLSAYDALFERLASDLDPMAAKLGEFVEEQDAVVGPRPLAGRRHLATPDQPDSGDGVVRGATRASGHHRRASPGEAGDAVDARGLDSLGKGHRRQNRDEPPRQHRLARPGGPSSRLAGCPG
jgi:hypothetical protein